MTTIITQGHKWWYLAKLRWINTRLATLFDCCLKQVLSSSSQIPNKISRKKIVGRWRNYGSAGNILGKSDAGLNFLLSSMKSYITFYIKPQLSFNKSFILNSFPAEHFLKNKSSGSTLFLYSWCIHLWMKVILVRMTHESLYPMPKTEKFYTPNMAQ